jgi:type II secretory pathway pseudopilin PulG
MHTTRNKLNKNKRAFTMVELLVCLVCMGFVCIGIGSIATAVKSYTTYIEDREATMIKEYQDVMNLKTHGIELRDKVNFPGNVRDVYQYNQGDEFFVSQAFAVKPNQEVTYEAENEQIISVNSDGVGHALSDGITYVKVTILTKNENGNYEHGVEVYYYPVMVLSERFKVETSMIRYYLYGGEHYVCWIHDKE